MAIYEVVSIFPDKAGFALNSETTWKASAWRRERSGRQLSGLTE